MKPYDASSHRGWFLLETRRVRGHASRRLLCQRRPPRPRRPRPRRAADHGPAADRAPARGGLGRPRAERRDLRPVQLGRGSRPPRGGSGRAAGDALRALPLAGRPGPAAPALALRPRRRPRGGRSGGLLAGPARPSRGRRRRPAGQPRGARGGVLRPDLRRCEDCSVGDLRPAARPDEPGSQFPVWRVVVTASWHLTPALGSEQPPLPRRGRRVTARSGRRQRLQCRSSQSASGIRIPAGPGFPAHRAHSTRSVRAS